MPETAAASIPAAALRLQESIAGPPGVMQADGTVVINVIRPTVGLGRGRHLYEAKMLQENAGVFGDHEEKGERVPGWRMFADHEAPAAIKARQGLPRPIRHIGGRMEESWWNPDVPAEGRYGQGAVQARVRPVGMVRKLIEEDPRILEASINADATGVHPGNVDGQQVWVVEGIQGGGSVDWVSEGGAGGKVVELMEAMIDEVGAGDGDDPLAVLEALSNDEIADYLRDKRSGLLEAAGDDKHTPEGGEMAITPEELQEAIQNEDSGVREYIHGLVEAQLQEGAETIRAEAKAEADRQVQLRDMRDSAHRMIEATDLPDTWKADLKDEFKLAEGKPTNKLDQVDEVDDAGEVTKGAEAFLTEAVEADIEKSKKRLAEANPTRVSGQGGDAGDGEGELAEAKETPYWKTVLQEAGVKDVDNVYA